MLLVSWLNFGFQEPKNNLQMPEEDNDNDSWQVRAFEEDTAAANLMGCTWPPRSYTCAFCRREFRSAQALGGHMNVHRRDRARLHEPAPPRAAAAAATCSNNKTSPPSSAIFIPTQELVANGLCLLYSLPNPNGFIINNPTLPTSVVAAAAHNNEMGHKDSSTIEEEVDLELRLGRK